MPDMPLVLFLRLNVTGVLSLRWVLYKRLMHINVMVIWPSPTVAHYYIQP